MHTTSKSELNTVPITASNLKMAPSTLYSAVNVNRQNVNNLRYADNVAMFISDKH